MRRGASRGRRCPALVTSIAALLAVMCVAVASAGAKPQVIEPGTAVGAAARASQQDQGRDRVRSAVRTEPAPRGKAAPTPIPSAGPPDAQGSGYADPFASLGAGSPFCNRSGIGPKASASCRVSGSIAQTYPLSSYGLDVRIGFSLTKVENNLLGALQNLAALVWMGLVYLLKGVLLLLEWAFSLDLIGEAMPGARRALATLHSRVLGEPWFLAAIAVAGLWGIWRGLVQRRTIETLGALAATVALMVAGLVVIANPAGTVGYASKLANDGSLGVLSAASTGRVKEPAESFADAMRGIYDSLVLEPWCALEFGSVDWCIERAGKRSGLTNADVWLAFPAQGGQRKSLYKLTKGEELESGGILGSGISLGELAGSALDGLTKGPLGQALGLGKEVLRGDDPKVSRQVQALVRKEPERVRMQEAGGTFPRLSLLALVAVGMLGAIGLLLYLGIRLLLAAILSLILLLFAPAMLLAPAFGDSGRRAFITWGKRLVGALAAKLVFALLLALVLVAASTIAALDIGWFGAWLLQLAFWWGVLLKRHELVGFLSVTGSPLRHGASGVRHWYRQARDARLAAASLAGGAGAVAAVPMLAIGRAGHARGAARREGVQSAARDELDERADSALHMQLAEARTTLDRNEELDRELRDTNRGLSKYDTLVQAHKEWGKPAPMPGDKEAALLRRRDVLEGSKQPPEATRQARSIVGAADRNLALRGSEFTDRERRALVEQRGRDIESDLSLEHERNLRFAGVDPRTFERASEQERSRMRAQSREAIERDRRLLAALPSEDRPRAGRREFKHARIELPPERLRARTAERREIQRQERARRRQRERLYRRR